VLLGYISNRAIALLVLERCSHLWRSTWAEYDAEVQPPLVSKEANRWTVSFVWVLPKYRKQGIADRLVRTAASWAKIPVGQFAWHTPFTESGGRLVRRHCPQVFFVGK